MQQVGWVLAHLPGHSSHLKQQPQGLLYFRERLQSWIQNSPGGDAAKSGHGTSSSSSIKLFPDSSDNCGFSTIYFPRFLKGFWHFYIAWKSLHDTHRQHNTEQVVHFNTILTLKNLKCFTTSNQHWTMLLNCTRRHCRAPNDSSRDRISKAELADRIMESPNPLDKVQT